MRKALAITFILIFSVAGIFFWRYYRTSSITSWDLVSLKALFVIETSDVNNFLKKVNHLQIHQSSAFQQVIDWDKEFGHRKVLITIHKASNGKLDTAFIIPQSRIERMENRYKNSSSRILNGYTIYDIKNTVNNFSFVTVENNVIIGSSFIVEDAIRIANTKKSFKERYSEIFQLTSLKSDDGNLYVNLDQLGSLKKDNQGIFGSLSLYDIKIDENQILLNGFAVDSPKPSFLSLFKGQKPGAFTLKKLIPSKCVAISYYYISNPNSWFDRQAKYVSAYQENVEVLRKEIGFKEIQSQIQNEIAVCNFKSADKSEEAFFLKVNGEEIIKILKNISDSSYSEVLAGYSIRKLKKSFCASFWPLTTNQELLFYTYIDNCLVFAESLNLLQFIISEIENDNTLAKSVELNKFLSETLQESNISYYVLNCDPDLFSDFGFGKESFSLDKVAIQFSALDVNFYSNAILKFDDKTVKHVPLIASNNNFLPLKQSLRSFQLVINHTDKSNELICQDSSNFLNLISKNGLSWSAKVDGEIKSKIQQIDYYNNKKLQYFFLTDNELYLVDRLGRNVPSFPKLYSGSRVLFARIIDYDQSKNYRFMIIDEDGKIFILDKKGLPLRGWEPKQMPDKIIDANHQRIFGKDYFYCLLEDGRFYLFNRSGDVVKKFPIETKLRTVGCFYVRGGEYFGLLSDEGVLFRISASGEILKKEPLLKNSNQSKFRIVNDKDHVLILRTDKSKLAFFDVDGNILFEKENPASEQIEVDYFHSDRQIISLFDKVQNLIILYDGKGNELLKQPIEATLPPVVEFQSKATTKLHYVNGKRLYSLII